MKDIHVVKKSFATIDILIKKSNSKTCKAVAIRQVT